MLRKLINFIEIVIGKKILILPKNIIKETKSTATKSKFGFWYVGNVFNTQDIAYGMAYNNGIIEEKETELVTYLLRETKSDNKFVFYDIGANTGYYGILAAHLNMNTEVHSFEPILEHLECLEESIKINRLESQVVVHPFALGSENISTIIHVAGSGSSIGSEFLDESIEDRQIEVKKLDDLNIPVPNFIKIDVEGYELPVLKGSINKIKAGLPILFVEIAYTLKNIGRQFINKDFDETISFMENLGYKTYIMDGSLKEFTGVKPDGVYMYLFLHGEKHSGIIKEILNK